MKTWYLLVLTALLLPGSALAQDSAGAKGKALSPEERAQYVKLCQSECELSSQLKVLTELAEAHAKRAPEVPNANTTDRAKWEAELVQELRDKSTALLGQLNEVTKQRLAFEAGHGPVPAAVLATGVLEDGKNYGPEEFLYLYKVDEQLVRVRQELAATAEAVKGYYSQLQTNTTPEAVLRVSGLLEENARAKRLWEREQVEMELKKLEFRALRRP